MVVLGLDGASLGNISETMKERDLPAFRKLLTREDSADLNSVYPYVTAPAWTSIFSGVNPGKHGIFEMFKLKGSSLVPANMAESQVPFVWDLVSWSNKRVLAMGPPFYYPAPKVNGVFVTGRFVPRLSCYPESVRENYSLAGYEYKDIPLEDEIEAVIELGPARVGRTMIHELKTRIQSSLELFDSRKWDLVLLIDSLPDDLFHICYDDKKIVADMFVALDSWLANILQRLGPDDSLLVVSDHGFSGVEGVFFMNEWLRSQKYMVHRDSLAVKTLASFGLTWDAMSRPGFASRTYGFLLRRFPWLVQRMKNQVRDNVLLDRANPGQSARVTAFNINEPVAWLRTNETREPDASNLHASLKGGLTRLEKEGLLSRVIETKDIYFGGREDEAPGQLIVEAKEGFVIDSVRWNNGKLFGKPLITKRGAHRRSGLFMYKGPHSGVLRDHLTVYDVTPTVLDLMKLPTPNIVDGTSVFQGAENWRLDVPQGL